MKVYFNLKLKRSLFFFHVCDANDTKIKRRKSQTRRDEKLKKDGW